MCLTVGYARSDSGIIITETAGIILETGDYTFIVPPTLYPQNWENGENRLQLKTVYATCYLGLLLKSVETAAPRIGVRYTYRGRNREMLGLFGPAFVIDFWIQLLSQTSVICAVRSSEKFFLLIPDCRGLQSRTESFNVQNTAARTESTSLMSTTPNSKPTHAHSKIFSFV